MLWLQNGLARRKAMRPFVRVLWWLVYIAENLRNVGSYTMQLQAMLNESGGVTVVSGKHLPSHTVQFTITGRSPLSFLSFVQTASHKHSA